MSSSPALPPARRIALPAHRLSDGSTAAPITLSVHEAGSGPAVVLSHGFPELAYSWRHQIPALVEAGFRVIAPDQRGYGASDRPEAIADYDIHHLTGDLVALLDALGIEKAVFVGHDWGGLVVWMMPLLHPERSAGVVGVNTPYLPRAPIAPTQLMRAMVGGQDEKMYMLWFQTPGLAEGVMDRQVGLVFEKLMRSAIPFERFAQEQAAMGGDMNPFRRLAEIPEMGEPILSAEEMDHYVRTFERTGFRGGINWYRNLDRNWETTPQLAGAKIPVPSLMVTAAWDPVLRPEMAAGMSALVPDLELVRIEECGHWTQQEKPAELNRALVGWLGRRFR
ncbi:MAG TPA: alpha/beta hydrolase [Myxococcota bacterium]|jgi:pimeloyl-ACP methyl ester carboxylesterase|nr:alpha/beta hydrolase [Myxococcota bacterium]